MGIACSSYWPFMESMNALETSMRSQICGSMNWVLEFWPLMVLRNLIEFSLRSLRVRFISGKHFVDAMSHLRAFGHDWIEILPASMHTKNLVSSPENGNIAPRLAPMHGFCMFCASAALYMRPKIANNPNKLSVFI